MTARLTALAGALTLLVACDSPAPAPPPETKADVGVDSAAAARPFQARLLDLVPSRGDDSAPSVARATALFPDCRLALPAGAAEASGSCTPAAAGAPAVAIRLHAAGDQAAGLRLSAPGTASFDPLAGQSVLRAQVLCSELTLVASASTEVYRVSAPGKQDFVYLEMRETGDAGGPSYTLSLKPFAPGGECAAIAAEMQFFDGTAARAALPPAAATSPFSN